MNIPSYKPYVSEKEKTYVIDALERGQISGDGFYTERVVAFIEKSFKASKALMMTSGTHALELAVILADLGPDDEVIMPSFTFSSTANAVLLRGAKPVFIEVKADTLNIDPVDLERKITAKTKAIIPVHYAGVACDMDRLMTIAANHHLQVIEDAAQGVNAKYRGQYLGTIGDFGCYSFHGTKNYTCGEGGALLIHEKNTQIIEKAEISRQKGTNRSQFLRGDVHNYNWLDQGSSYSPSDLLMAVLLAQLEVMQEITEQRKAIYTLYRNAFEPYEKQGILKVMEIPPECESNYHIFWVMFDRQVIRDFVLAELKSRGVAASFHFLPLHSSPMGRKMGYQPSDLPVTEKSAQGLLRLPLYAGMTEGEYHYVIKTTEAVIGGL
ncbi:TDP-4-keto-6-deoxy-D-glucose transaminase [Desulfitobacterium dichloroeliminans LMG P-21439]|uniref:TDP-4-keto-6-deoxy-D-glucose transaminase n=1 Tax=Desulfitobacterium dichloroeliminans (strain LMG P-21439 / DCA1) TaxID=871963 RepID=L0FBQ8_DESDL|nr:dTDP-4-amino-4,6-dideoxygalactose transaminase [Desulfitobacterium dichloroeliminans]AGA70383.1 TDP-4-keto-6-deoxy-D-glucose transaminase [Desulfitobacterium dichloroeliminans LMG P-21439]